MTDTALNGQRDQHVKAQAEVGNERYQVLAVGASAGSQRCWRSLGRYPSMETALRARVQDVLRQLVGNHGWLTNAEHLIIGPGHAGPATVHSFLTQLGNEPSADEDSSPLDLEGSRQWLLAAHELR